MKEVAHYIEQLLLRHDCVIIPGLGGFITQEQSANYAKEENLFLPPYRNVSFNPSLDMNDGVFVHEVAYDCGVSYSDALIMVRHEVNSIKQNLHREGSLYIPGIGCLLLTEDGNYDFEPLLCGVLAPELYGLDSVYVEPIEREAKSNIVSLEVEEVKNDKDTLSFRIPKSVIRYAVAVIVAVVLYFTCIAPVQTSMVGTHAEASAFHDIWSMVLAKANTETVSPNVQEVETQRQNTASKAQSTPKTNTKEQSSSVADKPKAAKKAEYVPKAIAPYTVVIASAVPEAGAYRMVKDLRRSGVKGARVLYECSMYRVVYGAYTSEGEAHAALRQLRSTNNGVFGHSWICRVQ